MPVSKLIRLWRSGSQDGIVFRNVTTSLMARGVSILSTLIAIPIVLNHFGAEHYGIWIIALALGSLFTLADFGVINAMLSMIAQAFGRNDRDSMRKLLSTSLVMAMAFSLTLLAALFASVWLLDWGQLLGITNKAMVREAESVILITGIGYAIQFPLAAVRHARLGMLEGVPVNLWDLAGSLLGTIGLVTSILWGGDLVTAAALWAILPSVPKAVSAMQYFFASGREFRPSLHDVDKRTSRILLASGLIFTLSGLSQVLALQSDQLLIARFLSLADVAPYSVVQRLFSQPQIFVTLLVAAQWPAYGEALGRGDGDWIVRHFLHSLAGIIAFASLCSIGMAIFCKEILQLWIGHAVVANPLLVAGMAVYCVVSCIAAALIAFYLALGLNRQVILMQLGMFVISFPLSILLLQRIGSAGAIIGTTTGYFFCVVVPSAAILRKTFQGFPRLHEHSDAARSPFEKSSMTD